jgi:DNA-directed RNA polymerase specialized sigma24 family protein
VGSVLDGRSRGPRTDVSGAACTAPFTPPWPPCGASSPRASSRRWRLVRDLGVAEELAHDALVAALEHWPKDGLPDKPGAWLMTTAKNRALDLAAPAPDGRCKRHLDSANDLRPCRPRGARLQSTTWTARAHDDIGDDLLRLIFTACHPVLSSDARVALTLKLLGGLTTDEIARACLVPEATIAQRIVRAKRTLATPVCLSRCRSAARTGAAAGLVLEVVYLIFNEGYTATAVSDWMRPALCDEALRLARMLAEPGTPRGRGAWPGRLDGTAGLAHAGPHRRPRPPGAAGPAGPRPLGHAADPPWPGRAGTAPMRWRKRPGSYPCRPRLPPAMHCAPTV